MERVLKPKGVAIVTTEYIINGKDHAEFFNSQNIYSDLIDKVKETQDITIYYYYMNAAAAQLLILTRPKRSIIICDFNWLFL
jgi:hypothetical protein